MTRCPECGSSDCVSERYDFGIDRECGYRDAGERGICVSCGHEGPIEDFSDSRQIHSSGPRAGGDRRPA